MEFLLLFPSVPSDLSELTCQVFIVLLNTALQVQSVCVPAVQTASLLGVVSRRKRGDAAPPGGQEGASCVVELHRGRCIFTHWPQIK